MKSNLLSKINICLFLLLISPILSPQLFAQIEIEQAGPIFNSQNLISSIFLGDGVEVINIDFQGDENALGYFTNGQNDVGISRGLVMSTGEASTAATPNNAGGTSDNTNGGTSDQFLSQIASAGLNNVARYTITFIPVADTLRFQYTFASEEYPEYACSNFNDVFGFFIYGPGINGGFPNNAENIARVPDPADPTGLTFTTWPVSINNVNPGVVGANGSIDNCTPPDGTLAFSTYYNDNTGSDFLTFDGYTDVLTAQAVVTPCEEYTIVLAIGDVSDPLFDSAVFLEAKSFGTGSLDVEAATVSLDGTVTEGCSDGVLSFTLPSAVESDFPLEYTIFGTAENGVDYETIPGDLFIPAGSNNVSVPVIAFEDDLFEGAESIGIDVQRDLCNRDTFFFFIRDNDILPSNMEDVTICNGDSVQLDATVPVVQPEPPTFENTTDYPIVNIFQNNPPPPGTDPTMSPIQVFGVQPTILNEETIKRICIDVDHKFIGDVDVFLMSPGGQILELTTDNGEGGDHYTQTCFTPVATDTINFGSAAPKEAAPFTGDWQPEGVWSDLWDGENPTNGIWQLILKDDSMGFDGTLLGWSICFQPLYRVFYSWFPTTGLSCADCPDPIANPDVSTTYVVTATDIYGCVVEDSVHIEVLDVLPAPDVQCTDITTNSINFEWIALAGATGGYEVNVNGAGWIPASGILSHQVNGLSLGQDVTIEVRGLANCDGTIGTVTCMVPNCTPPQGAISNVNNVSCNGGNDGSVEINANGANPPFVYSLNSQSNPTGIFDGLTQGTYNVIVTDDLGCATGVEVIITEPAIISSQGILVNDASCNGGADGSITVEVDGGTYPYTFDWNLTDADSIQDGLPLGTYYVTITDGVGCSTLDSVTVSEPDQIILSTQVNSVSCNGLTDGSAEVIVIGGTGPFDYLWDSNANDQTDSLAIDLNAGIYFVTITDALGCTQSTAAQVFEKPAIDLSITGVNPDCNGAATGSASVIAGGGAGNFNYLWNDGTNQTMSTATGLPMGDFTVTVTDIDGCSDSINISLSEPAGLTLDSQTDSVSCFGLSTGMATLTVDGGTYPYTYTWSDDPMASDSIRTDLSAGPVQVTITDGMACSSTLDLIIFEPSEISIAIDSSPASCFGANDGSVTVNVDGGNGNYTYAWDGPGGSNSNLPALGPGVYTVTVLDANSCEVTASATVTEPSAIILDTQVTASCNGDSNGAATVLPQGGTGPYDVQWDSNANDQTTDEAIDLAAGTYFVTVTDAVGCTQLTSAQVMESPAIDLSVVGVNPDCNGASTGSASVMASGGVGNYTYLWNDTGSQTDATAIDLPMGDYTVTVTDNDGCSQSIDISLTEPAGLNLSTQTDSVSCFGQNDGGAVLTVSGGTSPYIYAWSDDPMAMDSTRTDLSAGLVQVTITDGMDCSSTLDLTILEPSEVSIAIDATPISCFGANDGEVVVNVDGGVGNHTYTWDGPGGNTPSLNSLTPGTYTVTVLDANNCEVTASTIVTEPLEISLTTQVNAICNGASDGTALVLPQGGTAPYDFQWDSNANDQITQEASSLAAGTYVVTVTDAAGCTQSISADIFESPAIDLSITGVDVNCFSEGNGLATVTALGGTPPFTYQWNDANNQTADTATDLPAGQYTVTVSDQGACTQEISIVINEPLVISIVDQSDGVNCFGGSDGAAVLEVSGGVYPYSYTWSDNAAINDSTRTDLSAGIVTAMVMDANGCSNSIGITINEPAPIQLLGDNEPVACNGGTNGSATIMANGGSGNYTYQWDSQANDQTTSTATSLPAGTFFVTVTDDQGCSASLGVDVLQATSVSIDATTEDVICFGASGGSIVLDVDGGNGPYNYQWDGPNGFSATDNTIDDLFAGTYFVTITDNNNCMSLDQFDVDQPSSTISSTMSPPDSVCFGASNGAAVVTASGGTGSLTYNWSFNNQSSTSISGLPGGEHFVTITDAQGCSWIDTALIVERPEIDVQLSQVAPLCFNGNDGTAQVETILEGGLPGDINAYSFSWDNGQSSSNANQLVGGQTYTIVATASNACTSTASISIDNPTEIGGALVSTIPVSCNNGSDGSITVSGTGGTAPYTYTWNDASAQTTATAENLSAGEYLVTISDANGCISSLPFTLSSPAVIAIDFSVSDVLCPGDANGQIEAIVSGGTAPYNYLWSSGDLTSAVDSIIAGTYEVTITDANGCTLIQSEIIDAPDVLRANLNIEELSCHDSRDGRINIEPVGGVPPYRYSMDGFEYDGSPVRIGLTAGDYDIFLQDANGCAWQNTINIPNPPAVEVDPGEDLQMELGDSLQLSAEVFNTVGDYQLTWSAPYLGTLVCDPDTLTTCEMPWTHTQNTITYTAAAVDANGCYGEAEVKVEVLKPRPIHVPTAFTPNADSANDRLLIHGKAGSQVILFQVFDRWGELVFQSGGFEVNNEDRGWDGNFRGKAMNTGVYVWYAEVEFLDGRKEAYQGNTTLLR